MVLSPRSVSCLVGSSAGAAVAGSCASSAKESVAGECCGRVGG